MRSKLRVLLGLNVVDATLIVGDAGILFGNKTSLAIYNKFELTGIPDNDAQTLIGNTIDDVDESDGVITIKFKKNNASIKIDMKDDAYTGPEAIQLRVPGEPIVIWN